MTDDRPDSDDPASREPSVFSGKQVLLGLLVIAVVLQLFFIWLVWGTRRAKESLPADHPIHHSTAPSVEHITGGDE